MFEFGVVERFGDVDCDDGDYCDYEWLYLDGCGGDFGGLFFYLWFGIGFVFVLYCYYVGVYWCWDVFDFLCVDIGELY